MVLPYFKSNVASRLDFLPKIDLCQIQFMVKTVFCKEVLHLISSVTWKMFIYLFVFKFNWKDSKTLKAEVVKFEKYSTFAKKLKLLTR